MKEVLKIGVPAMLESVVAVIITTIDTRMISVLGKEAVSAVSFTSQPKLLVFSVFFALGTATSIFTAQALGRKDRREANGYFHMVLRLTIFLSVVLGILFGIFARPVMLLCNRQEDTVGMSVIFFRIIMTCMLFQNLPVIFNAALRGIGKTTITLYASLVMGAVDIVVNYLLIEGHLGFPRLEIAGDAIGTVSGSVAACAVSIFYLKRHSDFLSLKGIFSGQTSAPALRQQLQNKAAGIISENFLTRVGFLLSSIIVSTQASSQTAVYSVAMILLNYSFAFGNGLQAAAVALVGRSVGAKAIQEIRKYAGNCLLLGAALSAVLSAVYIIGANWFFRLFFSDTEAIDLGIKFSVIAAALTFLQIIRIVHVGILRGFGEVKIPLLTATVCVLLINPGTSYLFTAIIPYGIWGIWIGSLISQTVWFLSMAVKSHQYLYLAARKI